MGPLYYPMKEVIITSLGLVFDLYGKTLRQWYLLSQNLSLKLVPCPSSFTKRYRVGNIKSSPCLFAGDTSLYIIRENFVQTSVVFNFDLSQLHVYAWPTSWHAIFNHSENKKSVLFSRKLMKPIHPVLHMNQHLLKNIWDFPFIMIFHVMNFLVA